ncbi:beta-ketoacyl synthase chain length factor [Candidatus Magnetominusculus dajiuhuensis]|uniref:beta-ketoacyl synthase chain length factor n=1 Tax=Candidatus Magnetominusculus dajiuhuensis TaxID=3137712 RepID=UPI003B42EB73
MTRLAVTGVGAISPAGVGVSTLAEAAALGHRVAANPISEAAVAVLRKIRRSAAITSYAVTAVEEVLRDRGVSDFGDCALISGVTNGALNFSTGFHHTLVAEAKDTASPTLFSESVLNAPAGNASIIFNIRGPVHSIIGGQSVAVKALMLAATLIETGRARRAIVVCAEERNELSSFCYSRFNPKAARVFSEGAGAVLIEPVDEQRPINPVKLCSISGYAACTIPDSPQLALQRAIDGALSMAGLAAADIGVAVSDYKTTPLFRDIPTLGFFDCLGYAFCVSTMWNIILAAIACGGGCPVNPLFAAGLKKYAKHSEINHVIIYAAEEDGDAAAVILSRVSES